MNSKAGQITLFFIIGFVALMSFILFTTLNDSEVIDEAPVSSSQPVVSFVESCLEQTAEEGLLVLGAQGGYAKPSSGLSYVTGMVPYYVNGETVEFPKIMDIEGELNNYINSNLESCINDFRNLPGQAVVAQSPVAHTQIQNDNVVVTLEYPLEIQAGDTKTMHDQFLVTVPFDFNSVYEVVDTIMSEQESDPLSIHFEFLARSAYDNKYFFELTEMSDDVIIYSLIFNSLKINNEPYRFNFAAKYDW